MGGGEKVASLEGPAVAMHLAMSPSCASEKASPSEFGPKTKGSWITKAPYEAHSLRGGAEEEGSVQGPLSVPPTP